MAGGSVKVSFVILVICLFQAGNEHLK
jgi:hypothetical protein